MSDRTERTAYEDTIYFLEGRLALAKARANEAHDAWFGTEGAPGTFEAWNYAIGQQLVLSNTIANLTDIRDELFS